MFLAAIEWNLLREVETRYWVVFASKFADPEMMMGGVMIPANIASAYRKSAESSIKYLQFWDIVENGA